MEKLFTAIHSLGRPVIYGVISRNGQANIVIGVETQEDETIIKSMIMGLLTGIEVENCSFDFSKSGSETGTGGFICKRQTWDRVDRYERIVVERIEAFHHY